MKRSENEFGRFQFGYVGEESRLPGCFWTAKVVGGGRHGAEKVGEACNGFGSYSDDTK